MIWVFLVVIGYICGSIPVGYLIAKAKGINIQEVGSGNIGATNIARVMGIKAGIITFVLDVSKGLLTALIVQRLTGSREMGLVAGISAIAGHSFSAFLKFKGGKAAATSLGVIFALQPGLGGIVFVIWGLFLLAFGFVSFASIAAAVCLAVLSLCFERSYVINLTIVVLSTLIIFKHRSNIQRLLDGEESTIWEDMMRKKWAKKPPRPGVTRVGFLVNTNDDPEFFKRYASKKFKILKIVPSWFIYHVLRKWIPTVFYSLGRVVIQSKTGQSLEVIYQGVPLSEKELKTWPEWKAIPILAKAVCYLEQQGCTVVGLGGYTSIAGQGGKTLAKMFSDRIAITTGNGFTSLSGVDGFMQTARKAGYTLSEESIAIIGVGSVGKAAAILLAPFVKELLLVKHQHSLQPFIQEHGLTNAREVSLAEALLQSKLFLTVTSAIGGLNVNANDFQEGSIIVDLARPRDIAEVVDKRQSILVIEGAIIEAFNTIEQTFTFGLELGQFFGCMVETMLLGLEGIRSGAYSISDWISAGWLSDLKVLGAKHGFELASPRQFDKALPIERWRSYLDSSGRREVAV